jgi:predicted alpha/beta-fold hydrolase
VNKIENPATQLEKVSELFSRTRLHFQRHPFQPHPWFQNGHAQTLAAFAWPRRRRYQPTGDEARLFETASDVTVVGHCRWQTDRNQHATVVIWHGIEGSSTSNYMLSTAGKAFAAGFNVIRMNLRTCGGTEHLTPTIYHGGLTDDLREVVRQLIEKDRLPRLFLVGFSLGGNMVLKLAGEWGDNPPKEVVALCAVSPSIDLNASAALILKRSNWLYHRDFVQRLKKRIRTKHKLFPDQYDISGLSSVRTLREFDNRFTAQAHGFADAEDYYFKASSIRVINRIRVPALIIHAQDDPFIPFTPLRDDAVSGNPYILLIDPERGGHVAFLSTRNGEQELSGEASNSNSTDGVDRFWAENRLVDFLKIAGEVIR